MGTFSQRGLETGKASDLRRADLTCRHSRWDCIPFHPTTPERCDVWSPRGDGRIVLSEPENKQGKRVNLHWRTKTELFDYRASIII